MQKQSAVKAWTMLLMSLPKGIVAFVIAVTGLCVSLPLIILWVGLPLLGATLTACRWMMVKEQQFTLDWYRSDSQSLHRLDDKLSLRWEGWRSLLSLLGKGQTYQGVLYSILQLPIGIVGFTLGIVLPVTAYAVMLSPFAYKVSIDFFNLDLFQSSWSFFPFYLEITSAQRSWIAGGIGLVLVFLQPMILRALGRMYAAYIQMVSKTI
ncbi:sensor domain-containing protein [Bacillus sp. FJAT-28004]|uniref:sensor domain-containing protein n=1 Tax=Bacillus sp. FJAT-28004 TaxID=1679165 RepID=UPI0006B4C7B5|nr:sensor domain-containing protein [Bacillus sp. FJAT-28004]